MQDRDIHQAERALFDLMRGRIIRVTDPGSDLEGGVLIGPVEGLHASTLQSLVRLGGEALRLVITHHRARAVGLTGAAGALPEASGGNGGFPRGFSLSVPAEVTVPSILSLATSRLLPPAAAESARPASDCENGGLSLARLGRLIPAVLAAPVPPLRDGSRDSRTALRDALDCGAILDVTTGQIEALDLQPAVELIQVSDAAVPLPEAENARFVLFREPRGLQEHVAIVIGKPESWPDPVPVRLHSACLTGDLFGSLRCDCGDQLRGSLRLFAERGGGVLVYLAQEGRGIGLGNKLRAYVLQQEGLDTVDADGVLGFGADERRYDVAVDMLRQLGVTRVELLTNNPEKVRAVEAGGIQVLDRQPLHGTLNRHNLPYVSAKVRRAGHWLGEMLSESLPGD